MLINISIDGIDNFVFEWFLYDCVVVYCEFGYVVVGENVFFGQIEGIYDCDDVIVVCVCFFNIFDQFCCDQFGYVFVKVGWVQQDMLFEIVKEEYVWV